MKVFKAWRCIAKHGLNCLESNTIKVRTLVFKAGVGIARRGMKHIGMSIYNLQGWMENALMDFDRDTFFHGITLIRKGKEIYSQCPRVRWQERPWASGCFVRSKEGEATRVVLVNA